jgi:hypothetical protein
MMKCSGTHISPEAHDPSSIISKGTEAFCDLKIGRTVWRESGSLQRI